MKASQFYVIIIEVLSAITIFNNTTNKIILKKKSCKYKISKQLPKSINSFSIFFLLPCNRKYNIQQTKA